MNEAIENKEPFEHVNDIIDGKRYDSSTATLVCSYTQIGTPTSCHLFKSPDGAYFARVKKVFYRGSYNLYLCLPEDIFEYAELIPYEEKSGLDCVGRFILYCCPKDRRSKIADWYEEVRGVKLPTA